MFIMRSGCKSDLGIRTANIVGMFKSRPAPIVGFQRHDARSWTTSADRYAEQNFPMLGNFVGTHRARGWNPSGDRLHRRPQELAPQGVSIDVCEIKRNREAFAWKGQQANGPT